MITNIILMICSAFWIILALITNTKDIMSAIVFKVIPFFTGLAIIICAMNSLGWINIF